MHNVHCTSRLPSEYFNQVSSKKKTDSKDNYATYKEIENLNVNSKNLKQLFENNKDKLNQTKIKENGNYINGFNSPLDNEIAYSSCRFEDEKSFNYPLNLSSKSRRLPQKLKHDKQLNERSSFSTSLISNKLF